MPPLSMQKRKGWTKRETTMLVFDAMLPRNHSTMVLVYLIGASAAVKCKYRGSITTYKDERDRRNPNES